MPVDWRSIREAASRGILGVQRRDYHRLIAAAIETLYREDLDAHAERLYNAQPGVDLAVRSEARTYFAGGPGTLSQSVVGPC